MGELTHTDSPYGPPNERSVRRKNRHGNKGLKTLQTFICREKPSRGVSVRLSVHCPLIN